MQWGHAMGSGLAIQQNKEYLSQNPGHLIENKENNIRKRVK